VGPYKGKYKASEHQQKKPGIDQSDMSVSVAEAKAGIEITHSRVFVV
jgi:hypothetical protein